MLEIRILTGLHRGAALPLEGETIRIGSGAENDIVLLDPGMPTAASVVYRSGASAWRYRTYRSSQPSGDAREHESDGTVLAAGGRWFAGPVLIGCEEEGAPWPAAPTHANGSNAPPRDASEKRSISGKTKLGALLAVVGVLALIGPLAWRSHPGAAARSSATVASPASIASDARGAAVRAIHGTLYPNQSIARPPFSIRSASSGPYGVGGTDDDQILIPGSRWREFTLVRIEPGRAVFTGPHAAELTW